MRVCIDFTRLTYDDHLDFEAEVGDGIVDSSRLMLRGAAPVRTQRAILWIFARHDDPTFTLADAGATRPAAVEWTTPEEPASDG